MVSSTHKYKEPNPNPDDYYYKVKCQVISIHDRGSRFEVANIDGPDADVVGYSLVSSNNTEAVYLMGGRKAARRNTRSAIIHKLACSNGYCEWRKLPQQLQQGRVYSMAFAIPSDFCKTNP